MKLEIRIWEARSERQKILGYFNKAGICPGTREYPLWQHLAEPNIWARAR